jgi:hypothetical protein
VERRQGYDVSEGPAVVGSGQFEKRQAWEPGPPCDCVMPAIEIAASDYVWMTTELVSLVKRR